MFSVNDFDETLPGPFEWDVKRLVASFAVAGRDRGFDDKQREKINLDVTRAYREGMQRYAAPMRSLDLWYSRIDVDELLEQLRPRRRRRSNPSVRAQRRQNAHEGQHEGIRQAHHVVDGELRIAATRR